MKKTFTYQFITSLLLLVVLSIGEAWGATQTFTFTGSSAATALGVSAPASTSTGTSINNKSITQTPITISFAAGTGNNPVFWQTTTSGTYQVRVYNGNTVTISAASGYVINAITANGSSTGGTTYWNGDVLNGGVSNASLTSKTFSCIKSTVQINTITVTYSSTCDKSVGLSAPAAGQINGTISLGSTSVTTCSSTATDRQVTITVTPSTGYNAPDALTFTKTSGTATATKVSGPTGSGPYTYVYRFAQNDNGAGTFGAICTAKTTTVSFNQNGGEGGQTSDVTATYGQAMPTPITTPTRYGHTFGGYYDGTGGTGNKYYNADGTSAATWNKAAATATLYAKWTEHGLTNYRTTCCTPLAQVEGSANLSQWNAGVHIY